MSDEDDRTEEEITSVHAGELPRPAPGAARPPSSTALGPEGTVRLHGVAGAPPHAEGTVRLHGIDVPAGSREETVLLVTDAPAERMRPSDSGWGTVVLPGGGRPGAEDRTQLLPMGDAEPSAAISTTARFSVGAPEPLDAVDSASLTGIRSSSTGTAPAWSRGSGTAPPIEALTTVPVLRKGSTAPPSEGGAIAMAPGQGPTEPPLEGRTSVFVKSATPGPASPRTGGTAVIPPAASPAPDRHPLVPPVAGHTLVSGPNPAVGLTPTGGSPIVAPPGARAPGRAPVRGPTGAHPGLRAASDNSRLAWGFLLGVLLTVAILGAAVALALYLLR